MNREISERQTEPADTCESCEIPMPVNCQSCGMPMTDPEHYGGGNTENEYCVHCCRPDGSLKDYKEVFEGMVGLMMQSRNIDRAAAETAAREYMSVMPAWHGNA